MQNVEWKEEKRERGGVCICDLKLSSNTTIKEGQNGWVSKIELRMNVENDCDLENTVWPNLHALEWNLNVNWMHFLLPYEKSK